MELRTAVVTAMGTARATASATGELLVVRAASATVSGTAAATRLYLHCTMGLLTVTPLTRIIMAMTTLFLTVVMDYITLIIRLLAAVTAIMTAALIIAWAAAKTIVMGITTLGSIMTAALNFHPAASAAALQQQQLAAVPAAQLLLSALLQALAPGPVHLHQLLCLIHGHLDRIFTREEAILVLIFSSTLCPLILYSSNIYSFDHSKLTFSSAQPKTLYPCSDLPWKM